MKKLILALMVSMFSMAATAGTSMPCGMKLGTITTDAGGAIQGKTVAK